MITASLGRVSPSHKGEYNSSNIYTKLDIVSYLGSSYMVLKDTKGVTPVVGPNYQLLAGAGTNSEAYLATIPGTVSDAINQSILSSGFVTIDSFEVGATITQRNQALRHTATGNLYRWAGDLPKVVPANSTPTNSGGISNNSWLEVSDATLRQDVNELRDNTVRLTDNRNINLSYPVTNTENWGMRMQTLAKGKRVDGIYAYAEFNGAGSAGYGFHAVSYAYAGNGADTVGGVGGAVDGPGLGSGLVGNRQGDGGGNGVQGDRLGRGDGAGGEFRTSSAGICNAVRAIKQNPANGDPAGVGAALYAINNSNKGEGLYVYTTANNTDNNTGLIDRRNGQLGTASYVKVSGGGVRTGLIIAQSTHVTPSVESTGSTAVYGQDVQITANVTGSANSRGINLNNSATGGADGYGAVIVTDGANTTNYGVYANAAAAVSNYGGYFRASGGTNNYAIYCAAGDAFFAAAVQAPNLAVHADNAAASSSLAKGKFYRTETGQVMVVY